jgi:hypothetical protein
VLLFALWVFLLDRTIRQGPQEHAAGESAESDHPLADVFAARAKHD